MRLRSDPPRNAVEGTAEREPSMIERGVPANTVEPARLNSPRKRQEELVFPSRWVPDPPLVLQRRALAREPEERHDILAGFPGMSRYGTPHRRNRQGHTDGTVAHKPPRSLRQRSVWKTGSGRAPDPDVRLESDGLQEAKQPIDGHLLQAARQNPGHRAPRQPGASGHD